MRVVQETATVVKLRSPKRPELVVAAGVLIASFLMAIGAGLASIGQFNSSPFGYTGEFALAATLGPVLGYNLGLALNKQEAGRDAFLFWSSFYATFFALVAGYELYFTFTGLSGGQFFTSPAFFPVAILLTGTGGFSILVQTELVDPGRRRYLKQVLDLFSNKLSAAVLGGYGAATIFDNAYGVAVGILVFAAYTSFPWLKQHVLPLADSL